MTDQDRNYDEDEERQKGFLGRDHFLREEKRLPVTAGFLDKAGIPPGKAGPDGCAVYDWEDDVLGDDGTEGGPIAYDLIVPSASRPHLLKPTLETLFEHLDYKPRRLLIHDDAAFPGRQGMIQEIVEEIGRQYAIDTKLHLSDPPAFHSGALHWLLREAQGEFVLYSQDDFLTLRSVPVLRALRVMRKHGLHHIRFNKRETMEYKGTFRKLPVLFDDQVLSVSDHWYFQLNLGRRERIKTVVDWYTEQDVLSFREHMEAKINHALNRKAAGFNRLYKNTAFGLPPTEAQCMDPEIRRDFQRTFIWGAPGEPAFIKHIGTRPEDWAEERPRGGVEWKRGT